MHPTVVLWISYSTRVLTLLRCPALFMEFHLNGTQVAGSLTLSDQLSFITRTPKKELKISQDL